MMEARPESVRYFVDSYGHLIFVGDSERATITRGFWAMGMKHSKECLDSARAINAAGHSSAAFVWAVRAVEIFFRQCVALCTFYDEGLEVEPAIKKAKKAVGSGNWTRVWDLVERHRKPDDIPMTDTGEPAWAHWKTNAIRLRDDVVHGTMDVTSDQADWVIAYAERIIEWVTQRLSIADQGPLRGMLRDIVEVALEAAHADE